MHAVDSPSLPLRSKQMLEPPRDGVSAVQLLVPLEGTPLSGLQYAYVVSLSVAYFQPSCYACSCHLRCFQATFGVHATPVESMLPYQMLLASLLLFYF